MLSSNCEIVERAGRHVDVDRLVLAGRGLLIALTVNSFDPALSRHCNVNSRDRRVPDWHPSLPRATRLSVAVEPIRPRARKGVGGSRSGQGQGRHCAGEDAVAVARDARTRLAGHGEGQQPAANHVSSRVGKTSSWVSSCTAAATGIATRAPTMPSSAPPMRTATTVRPPGTLTARPMILGTSR